MGFGVSGGFWRCGGRFFGWRGHSAREEGDFRKVERDMHKEIL